MKTSALLLLSTVASAVRTAAATARSSDSIIDEIKNLEDFIPVVKTLLDAPFLIPASSYNALTRAIHANLSPEQQALVKRQGPSMEDFANGLKLLQGMATAVAATPPTTNIKAVQEESATQFPHAKRKKIRMGPYRLPSTNESNVQSVLFNSPGMTDIFKFDELKPCDSDTCVLLTMRAGLEYADGKDANTDTG
ncbi:hypothetical protein LTS18_011020, partial [Coniosporium uncinatum]